MPEPASKSTTVLQDKNAVFVSLSEPEGLTCEC